MTSRFAWPLSFGATLVDDHRARFRIWAPAQHSMAIELNAGTPIRMAPRDEGWFETEASCAPGTRYRYKLDNGLYVPDPASRAQQDDVHGPSLVIDPAAYRWRHFDWRGRPWHETTICELHVGALGGFAGVRRQLPRLADLGIAAIELISSPRQWTIPRSRLEDLSS